MSAVRDLVGKFDAERERLARFGRIREANVLAEAAESLEAALDAAGKVGEGFDFREHAVQWPDGKIVVGTEQESRERAARFGLTYLVRDVSQWASHPTTEEGK